ncbi:MAG: nucleoside:proton symporter [Magnetococcales bacterium]|nr:nucleoside:proton symporter [Magnetococcales bacterium]
MNLQSLTGLLVLPAIAWLLSENRARIPWRAVAGAFVLQLVMAPLLLKVPFVRTLFLPLNDAVLALQEATRTGTGFVFAYLGGGPLPFAATDPGATFILAFQALPLVLVMSALSALLFHWGILPRVVGGLSWLLRRTTGIGGALGLATAMNVFVGMVEAPLVIRPYLRHMSRGEIFAVMTAGMATIAGTMMALYATILGPVIPDALGHILIASLLSAPAALMIALLMVPDSGDGPTQGEVTLRRESGTAMEAITRGTMDGVGLLINIIALLIVLVALVALANRLLGALPPLDGAALTLERMLGWIMAPVVWLMGIPWDEAPAAGSLMGTKTILNEFIAYLNMAQLPEGALSPASRLIMTYALCGFANLGSLGIMLGGLVGMVPERRDEIVGLGLKSILAGTLATCLTGALAGLLGG